MRDRPTRSQTCRGLIMTLQSGCAIRLKPKTWMDPAALHWGHDVH
jgi:hypothetical protein